MENELFASALEDVAAGKSLTSDQIASFAHLGHEAVEAVRKTWAAIDTKSKLAFLSSLHTTEATSLHSDFNQVYRVGLGDPDAVIRRGAIESIVEDAAGVLLSPLLDALRADPDPSVRAAAGEALGEYALRAELGELIGWSPAAIRDELLSVVRDADEAIEVRSESLASVGYLDNPEVTAAIHRGYEDPRLLSGALTAMGHTANPVWLDLLALEARSELPATRELVAHAIADLGDEEGASVIVELVDDEDLEVRYAAITALGRLGGEEARDALLYALDDERDDIRALAEEMLVVLDDLDGGD